MKRFWILVWMCAAVGTQAHAQNAPCATPGEANAFLGVQTIRLWQGAAPQAKGSACQDIPTLTIFDPQPGHENGSAVVIFPGGAYAHLATNLEGRQIANWFNARGFRAFVLRYRLTSDGYVLPVPLLDARRAIQMVRARALDYHVNPNRIVVIGFSAGGHLAALAATQPVEADADAEDPIERVSSRPDFLVLGYPWIGAISSDTSHLSYCKIFNLMDRCEVLRTSYSPDLFVTAKTPPTGITRRMTRRCRWSRGSDSTRRLSRLVCRQRDTSSRMAPHGSGLGKGDASMDQWPGLLETWLRGQGLLTAGK